MNSLVSRMSNTAITERNNLVNSKHLDKREFSSHTL
jgi:hypothetical protein